MNISLLFSVCNIYDVNIHFEQNKTSERNAKVNY